jgi:phosphotransferase system  glucose/maltose/N-acetylglucosamine-specific IIC component
MTENIPTPLLTDEEIAQKAVLRKQRWIIAGIIAGLVILIGLAAWGIFALTQNPAVAANVRDIFIIAMAFMLLVVGIALVILMIQLATLINLLQNEVRPILQSTSETINTLRGTTEFLSENLVEPVIKLNSYLAGLRKFFDLLGFIRK